MWNKETYEKISIEFDRYGFEEEVEDILLQMAEQMAGRDIFEEEIKEVIREKNIEITGVGICFSEENDSSVLIKTIQIGDFKIEINDYFL